MVELHESMLVVPPWGRKGDRAEKGTFYFLGQKQKVFAGWTAATFVELHESMLVIRP